MVAANCRVANSCSDKITQQIDKCFHSNQLEPLVALCQCVAIALRASSSKAPEVPPMDWVVVEEVVEMMVVEVTQALHESPSRASTSSALPQRQSRRRGNTNTRSPRQHKSPDLAMRRGGWCALAGSAMCQWGEPESTREAPLCMTVPQSPSPHTESNLVSSGAIAWEEKENDRGEGMRRGLALGLVTRPS